MNIVIEPRKPARTPFAAIGTELLASSLMTDDLDRALNGFEDTVEIISSHRRDTLRHV